MFLCSPLLIFLEVWNLSKKHVFFCRYVKHKMQCTVSVVFLQFYSWLWKCFSLTAELSCFLWTRWTDHDSRREPIPRRECGSYSWFRGVRWLQVSVGSVRIFHAVLVQILTVVEKCVWIWFHMFLRCFTCGLSVLLTLKFIYCKYKSFIQ